MPNTSGGKPRAREREDKEAFEDAFDEIMDAIEEGAKSWLRQDGGELLVDMALYYAHKRVFDPLQLGLLPQAMVSGSGLVGAHGLVSCSLVGPCVSPSPPRDGSLGTHAWRPNVQPTTGYVDQDIFDLISGTVLNPYDPNVTTAAHYDTNSGIAGKVAIRDELYRQEDPDEGQFIRVVPEWVPSIRPRPAAREAGNVAPNRQPDPFARPNQRPRPEPRAEPSPVQEPRFETLEITVSATGVEQTLAVSAKPSPKGPRSRERKTAIRVPTAIKKLTNLTEIDDAVNCVWQQLPAKVTAPRKQAAARANRGGAPAPKSKSDDGKNTAYKNLKAPGRDAQQGLRVTLQAKVMDIYDNWDTLNRSWTDKTGTGTGFARAMRCLVENHFEDKAIGGANQLASDPFAKVGKGYGFGGYLGLGPTF